MTGDISLLDALLDIQITPVDTTDFRIHDLPMAFVAISPAVVGIQTQGDQWARVVATAPPQSRVGDVTWNDAYLTAPIVHRGVSATPESDAPATAEGIGAFIVVEARETVTLENSGDSSVTLALVEGLGLPSHNAP